MGQGFRPLDVGAIHMEDTLARVLRKPENKAIREELERNEKQVAEILDAMRVAMAETSYDRMIAAATVVARGFLPAMFARYAIRQTIERLLQLDAGPVTITIGPPFFIGQTVNGETLVFDVAGVVANGQHRMMGLAEARPGTKVQILVVTGVTQTKIYDVPVRRTATDILKLSNTNAAICRALAMLESGDIVFAYSKKFSISEVEEVWKRANETIQLFPRTAALPISAPMLAAFAYAYPIEPEAVQRLFEKIRDGEGLRKNDPAYTFRNWLVKNPLASRASLDERAYAMLNVISAELRGDTISSIHRTPMGYFYTNQKRRALNVEPTPSYKHDDETKKKLIARDARARQKVEAMTPKAVDDLLLLDFAGEE